MVLTDAAVRAAPQGVIWDSTLKGFGLRTGKQSKTFIVLVASGRRKKLGRYPLLSLAKARETARTILAEKTLGKIVPTHTAFEDARADYLKDCATRLRPSTVGVYTGYLNHFPFGRRSIADITALDILKVLKLMPPSQKEHVFRATRTFFAWCFHQHLIDLSPMERLDSPPIGKARERVLTDEELAKVYKTALKLQNSLQRLVYLLIRTGQRGGEMRHLQWANLGTDRITLPGAITKNGRTHTFPISEETYQVIHSFPKMGAYVLPSSRSHVRGKPVEVTSATSKARRDFEELCGVKDWTLHDLRRTFATNLQKLGVRLEVTEALLNHVSGTRAGIVGVYQRHDFFPEMRAAVALWEKKLQTLGA